MAFFIPPWLGQVSEAATTSLKILGGATAVGAIYVKLGFPIPATTGYVDGRFAQVQVELRTINTDVLTGQRKLIRSDKTLLRNERTTLEATKKNIDPEGVNYQIISNRLTEIDEALTVLSQEDEALRARLEKLK